MTELEYLTASLAKGQISRREFLGRTAGLGAAAALAGNALLGSPRPRRPRRAASRALRPMTASPTHSLDPATWPGSFTAACLGGALCSNLTELMPDQLFSVAGDLAESFEGSNTSMKWVFKLRKGLTFHNGKALTATDVASNPSVITWARPSKSPAKAVLALVGDIKADDPTTVVFTLTDSSPDFPYMVADYHLPIMPAKEGGGLDLSAPVGSGPFVMENLTFGTSAKLKRNPDYHKTAMPYPEASAALIEGLSR